MPGFPIRAAIIAVVSMSGDAERGENTSHMCTDL